MCSIIDKLIKEILLVVLFAPVVACSDEEAVVEPNMPQQETGLRFGIKRQPGSRVVNSGLSAEFADGDSIGCVIAFREKSGAFIYQCTTSWLYCEQTGMLVLDHYYHNEGKNCNWHDPAPTITDGIIHRHPNYDRKEGYVELLTSDAEYCFFFFYPFIDSEDIEESYKDVRTDGAYSIKIPFCAFELELNPDWDEWHKNQNRRKLIVTGMPDAEHTEGYKKGKSEFEHPHFKWTEYPCFASVAQGSSAQLDNSNFMWTRYIVDQNDGESPITKENDKTHYTVKLEFRKKMAAIDLVIDNSDMIKIIKDNPSCLYYRNIPEEGNYKDNGTYENYFIIGKRIDLSTGVLSDYPHWYRSDWGQPSSVNPVEYQSMYTSHVSDIYEDRNNGATYNRVRPCPMGNGVYRVILPPQESFKCELHFPDKNGNDRTINLYQKIPVLKENTLYTIRLQSVNEWEIIINDWQKGQGMLIEEDK